MCCSLGSASPERVFEEVGAYEATDEDEAYEQARRRYEEPKRVRRESSIANSPDSSHGRRAQAIEVKRHRHGAFEDERVPRNRDLGLPRGSIDEAEEEPISQFTSVEALQHESKGTIATMESQGIFEPHDELGLWLDPCDDSARLVGLLDNRDARA